VIQAVAQYPNRQQAVQAWINVHKQDPSLLQQVGKPIQVNGKGNAKHCANASTMTEILMLIPNNKHTKAYRRRCCDIIAQYMQNCASAAAGRPIADAQPRVPDITEEVRGVKRPYEVSTDELQIEERRLELEARRVEIEGRKCEIIIKQSQAQNEFEMKQTEIDAKRVENESKRVENEDRRADIEAKRLKIDTDRKCQPETVRSNHTACLRDEMELLGTTCELTAAHKSNYTSDIENFRSAPRFLHVCNEALPNVAKEPLGATPVSLNSRKHCPVSKESNYEYVKDLLVEHCGLSAKRASEMAQQGGFGAIIAGMYREKNDGNDPESNTKRSCAYIEPDVSNWIVPKLKELVKDKPNAGRPAMHKQTAAN